MLKRKRSMVMLLVLTSLMIPILLADTPPGSTTATLDTFGRDVWAGFICGAAVGAVIVGSGILLSGNIVMGAALAVSAGSHVAVVCAFL